MLVGLMRAITILGPVLTLTTLALAAMGCTDVAPNDPITVTVFSVLRPPSRITSGRNVDKNVGAATRCLQAGQTNQSLRGLMLRFTTSGLSRATMSPKACATFNAVKDPASEGNRPTLSSTSGGRI